MSRFLKTYQHWLATRPLLTQASTTAVAMALGDVISQVVVERKKSLDFYRTNRFLIYGFFITGPCLRGWYLTLEKVISKPGWLQPFKKVLADQVFCSLYLYVYVFYLFDIDQRAEAFVLSLLIFTPPFVTAFLFNMTLWRTHSLEEAKQKIIKDIVPVLKVNFQLWPIVQIANFTFVPLQHRVFVVNCVAVLWNTYLAYRSELVAKDDVKE